MFAFNPFKTTVLQEYLPAGYQYDNSWVQTLLSALEEGGVDCVDNTALLTDLSHAGKAVFNRQYDAGHWNALGAYYGVNHILEAMSKYSSLIRPNELSDFEITTQTETTLPVSNYPIEEDVPVFTPKAQISSVAEAYQFELQLSASFRDNGYLINPEHAGQNFPRVLVFQGSYMNTKGYRFLANALYEYIYIHDYQNIINLDYYVNLFQPDLVVFEMAEYTCSNNYFNESAMREKILNPSFPQLENPTEVTLSPDDMEIQVGNCFTVLSCTDVPDEAQYVYLSIDGKIYDMQKTDGGYSLTVMNVPIIKTASVRSSGNRGRTVLPLRPNLERRLSFLTANVRTT